MKNDWATKIKKLRLFAHGEPLLNKNILKMASYAKSQNVAEIIEVTTNGTLIDDSFIENVSESGIDIINISINGINERQYLEQCSYNLRYEEFINNIRKLYEKKGQVQIYIKLSDIGYSKQDIDIFLLRLETFATRFLLKVYLIRCGLGLILKEHLRLMLVGYMEKNTKRKGCAQQFSLR